MGRPKSLEAHIEVHGRALSGLRLLTPTDDPRQVRMHRLIQDVVAARSGPGSAARLRADLTAHALDRAESSVSGWVDRETRWELDPLLAYGWSLLDGGDVDAGPNSPTGSCPL